MSYTEITFDELANDDSFFDGLRTGDFCLVLGAGFSSGVMNKSTAFPTIPLSSQFVEHTNTKFNTQTKEYQSAASVWTYKVKEEKTLFLEFINLFLADEEKFDYQLFHSIFFPTWYNIYTFNFDNVLETILSKYIDIKYKIRSYPNDAGDDDDPDIIHLHGLLNTNSTINDIVFTSDSYSNLRNKQHDLYDVLHTDVDAKKKNLIIIGTQFNEQVVFDKFFLGLTRKDIKIYQFGLENGDIKEKPEFKEREYYFIKLEDKKGNIGTQTILQFFHEYKNKIENIKIAGAELIDKIFIKKAKEEGEKYGYQHSDFYLAKQYDKCQWYGIIKKWDVDREAYSKIKEEVHNSFKDENREPKIVALLLGRGGSGKSTLLRRLAIDCAYEYFAVIWVNYKELNEFVEKGLSQFAEYPHKRFLIIIEDWYRIKGTLKSPSLLINELCSYSNLRIIIGDRNIDDSISKEHRHNPHQNTFWLEVRENKKNLLEILEKFVEWKSVATELLKTEDDYDSSLYLILWTIGRTYQSREKISLTSHYNEGVLKGHFQSIIESDLRAIAKYYPGLAKALYYWAKVYATNKIFISFDTFDKIPTIFNETKVYRQYAFVPDEIKSIFEIYIHKSKGNVKSARDLELVAFNHDILAEEGLAQIGHEVISNCLPFGDDVKVQILDLITSEGDHFSSSIFLFYCLTTINKDVITNEKRLDYITKLYSKGNKGTYLNHLIYQNGILNSNEKGIWAENILTDHRNNEYPVSTICHCLKQLYKSDFGKTFAKELLEKNRKERVATPIICNCLEVLRETEEGKTFAKEFLEKNRTEKVEAQIINNCLEMLKATDEGKTFAKEFLEKNRIEKVAPEIICNCLEVLKATEDGKTFAKELLEKNRTVKVAPEIICNCLEVLKETEEGKTFAKELLEKNRKEKIAPGIICNCLEMLKETEEGKIFAKELLEKNRTEKVEHAIINNCLEMLKATEEGKTFAKEFLEKNRTEKVEHAIINNCLEMLKATEEGKTFAKELLEKNKTEKVAPEIICKCLEMLKETEEGKTFAKELLENDKTEKVAPEIVCKCLEALKETEDGINYADFFLRDKDWKKENMRIVFHSLECFSSSPILPQYVIGIVKEIIKDHFDKANTEKAKRNRYLHLLKIPFHTIPEWKYTTKIIINKFQQYSNKNIITNMLLAYRSHPHEIKNVCEHILNNWKKEILIEINQGYNKKRKPKEPHFGDHIKIALGHPNLISHAKKVSEEIVKAKEEKSVNIPDYLYEIADKIINEDCYPEWNVKKNDKSSTK